MHIRIIKPVSYTHLDVYKRQVEKTVEKIKEAELVLAVFDISSRPDGEDEKFIDELKSYLDKGGKAIGILNKSDLNVNKEALDRYSSVFEDKVIISAANKIGREEILKKAESLYIEMCIRGRIHSRKLLAKRFIFGRKENNIYRKSKNFFKVTFNNFGIS